MIIGKSNSMVNFALIDGARVGAQMGDILALAPISLSLYRESALADVAPYVLCLAPDTKAHHDVVQTCWGCSSGVFLRSDANLEELSKHFRHFLLVKTEDGRKLYFRFYDPRVLRVFLPSCTAQQAIEFFGPVHFFLVEDEDPNRAIIFWLEKAQLRRDIVDLTKGELAARLPARESASAGEKAPNVIV